MINLTIKNIKLGELEAYLESAEYRNSSFVPISRIRALSHINNPRAEMDDYCLFLAYDNDKLIGYLGAITDKLFVDENSEKVFWLSCMWVLPEYRRDGIALKLLLHAYKLFNGRVLITNFILRSKAAFERTGQYFDLFELEGIRGYCLLDLQTLFIRKYPKLSLVKPIFILADTLGNSVLEHRQRRKKKKMDLSCKFSEISSFDKSISTFIESEAKLSLFRRGVNEFAWIRQYPWVKKVEKYSKEAKRYYFSQESTEFEQYFIKVEQNNTVAGVLILTFFRGELKIPYMFYKPEVAKDIVKYIALLLIEKGLKTYVGYDQLINESLCDLGIFYYKRKSNYEFIAGKNLEGMLKNKDIKMFYGDGDGAFT